MSHPIEPMKIRWGSPLWSLNTPLYPAFLGFPLEAPSKLSWRMSKGGGVHLLNSWLCMLGFFFLIEFWLIWSLQLSHTIFSWGDVGRSSEYHSLIVRVSIMFWWNLFQIFSIGIVWSLNILLLRSFHMFHISKLGIRCHKVLRRLLWKGFWLQLGKVALRSPCTLPSFWQRKATFSQSFLPVWHVFIRWRVVSSSCLHMWHIDGPEKLHFLRLSHVRILLWERSHRNVETFGQLEVCQIFSHKLSLFNCSCIIILYASFVVKIPFSSYPHLKISLSSETMICLFCSSVLRSCWVCAELFGKNWFAFFHCLYSWVVTEFQNLLTLANWFISHSVFGWSCRMSLIFGNCYHESSQKRAVVPLLISQKFCSWMRLLCCMAKFQMAEPVLISVILILSSMGQLLAYLAVQREAHGVLGWASHLHQIFAPIDLLLCSGSLRPMPPAFLGKQTLSHFINAHLRLWPELPHR